jgi:8-oxo-dGTP diphosphatase
MTLPGGRVEQGKDPFDAVIREVAEETGCNGVVERLLGVDSRVIPAADRLPGFSGDHQNVGIFYQVRIVGGPLRPEPDGDIAESVWTPIPEVARLRRSSLVDVGLALGQERPATGHVATVRPFAGLGGGAAGRVRPLAILWATPHPSAGVVVRTILTHAPRCRARLYVHPHPYMLQTYYLRRDRYATTAHSPVDQDICIPQWA